MVNLTFDPPFRVASEEERKKVRQAEFHAGMFKKEDFPVEDVPISKVVGTQDKLDKDILNKKIATKSPAKPHFIKHGNNYYVQDGHHRVAAAILKGKDTIKAHVSNKSRLQEVQSRRDANYKATYGDK